jgi:outer membrane lipoprotein-sorting protein
MKQYIMLSAVLYTAWAGIANAEQPIAAPTPKVTENKLPALNARGNAGMSMEMPWQEEQTKPMVSLSAKDTALQQIEDYFNRITTMESTFVQVAPDGQITEGKFYLSRPGKVRWEYNPPASVVIVGKSGLITYYDKALDQISHSSIDSTPVSFLTRPRISFKSKDLEVKELKENATSYELTLTQTDKEVEGRVVLTFLKMPLELKKIEVIDAAEQHTLITFTSSTFGQPIKGDLFIIQNPRLFNNKR